MKMWLLLESSESSSPVHQSLWGEKKKHGKNSFCVQQSLWGKQGIHPWACVAWEERWKSRQVVEFMSLKDFKTQQPWASCCEFSGEEGTGWRSLTLCCFVILGKEWELIRKRIWRRLKGNLSVDVQNQLESIKPTGIKYGSLKDYLS